MGKLKIQSKNKLTSLTKREQTDLGEAAEKKNASEKVAAIVKTTTPSPDSSKNKENESSAKKKNGLVSKVTFKATKKLKNKLTKLKSKDEKKKEKYESIKENIVKQFKQADDTNESSKNQSTTEELNFVKRQSFNRVTNSVLKSLLAKKAAEKTESKISNATLPSNINKTIKKKDKSKLKKEIWHEKIGLIKQQIKEVKDKVKREKTVIVGDVKPMMESLQSSTFLFNIAEENTAKQNSQPTIATNKREINEQNIQRQQKKAIPRQSIRVKKSQEDISMFNQLLDYSDFAKNPTETLKKFIK